MRTQTGRSESGRMEVVFNRVRALEISLGRVVVHPFRLGIRSGKSHEYVYERNGLEFQTSLK